MLVWYEGFILLIRSDDLLKVTLLVLDSTSMQFLLRSSIPQFLRSDVYIVI